MFVLRQDGFQKIFGYYQADKRAASERQSSQVGGDFFCFGPNSGGCVVLIPERRKTYRGEKFGPN